MSETLAERQKNSQLSDGGNVWRELGGEIRCRSVSRHISSSGNFGQHAVLLDDDIKAWKGCLVPTFTLEDFI
jgi:hypothetical protein